MLFSKSVTNGLQVGGFVESPSMVMVTWKAETGEHRVTAIEVGGLFCEDVAVKGRVVDIIAVPMTKAVRTLYVCRLVKNAQEIGDWFRMQGMETLLPPGDMHVTIAYSRAQVNWDALHSQTDNLAVPPDFHRSVEPLGDKGAVVLKFQNPVLQSRWSEFKKAGASWDYPSYQPHVTLTYQTDPAMPFVPFPGEIVFGPEQFTELNESWSDNIVEKSKASKRSVDYSKGMQTRHCGVCTHFEMPHACDQVSGHIDADMWCRLFKRRVG